MSKTVIKVEPGRGVKKTVLRHLPGMRIIKTGLALLLGLLVYSFFPNLDAATIAIAAIVCLQQDIETTWKSSYNRALGTTVSGIYAYIFIQIFIYGLGINTHTVWFLVLVALAVVVQMQLFVLWKKRGAVVISAIVFLVICFSGYMDEPLQYTFYRVIDTLIGIAAAVFVDWLPPLNKIGDYYLRKKTHAEELVVKPDEAPESTTNN